MKKAVYSIFLVLFLSIALFAGYQIYSIASEYQTGETAAAELQQFIHMETVPAATEAVEETDEPVPTDAAESAEETQPAEDSFPYPTVDFAGLRQINSDVVAWIMIEGTNVNYPVVQGRDNSRYLTVMADGRKNAAGSIFMDYRCQADFSDRHTVIYGHYMGNGTMFHNVREYRRPGYFEEHPTGIILTPEKNFRFEVIAGYVAKPDSDAWELTFASDEDFSAWLAESMAASVFDSGIVPTAEDRIITLSTCTYEFNNARFVLICRVMPD